MHGHVHDACSIVYSIQCSIRIRTAMRMNIINLAARPLAHGSLLPPEINSFSVGGGSLGTGS